jgi:hypothetical protein
MVVHEDPTLNCACHKWILWVWTVRQFFRWLSTEVGLIEFMADRGDGNYFTFVRFYYLLLLLFIQNVKLERTFGGFAHKIICPFLVGKGTNLVV